MSLSRAEFHEQNLQGARAKAVELFAQKVPMQGAWLNWVAGQLYQLSPPEFVNMVRRELQRLQEPEWRA
mgnify:CR=1 FL=1